MAKRKYTTNTELKEKIEKSDKKSHRALKLTIISLCVGLVALALAVIYIPAIYNPIFGDLDIRYAGFDNQKELARIEIFNGYKSPLKDIEGDIEIYCKDANYTYSSELFILSEGKAIVSQEKNDLLFSPDEFFSKLYIKEEKDYCVDISIEMAEYTQVNKTLSVLRNVSVYEFRRVNDSIEFSKGTFNPLEKSTSLCLECQMRIRIRTSNKGEFTQTKEYIFLSEGHNPSIYRETYEGSQANRYRINRFSDNPVCINLNGNQCVEKLMNEFGIMNNINFPNSEPLFKITSGPFEKDATAGVEVYSHILTQEEILELFEQGPPLANS